jgi:hypothetical protein
MNISNTVLNWVNMYHQLITSRYTTKLGEESFSEVPQLKAAHTT